MQGNTFHSKRTSRATASTRREKRSMVIVGARPTTAKRGGRRKKSVSATYRRFDEHSNGSNISAESSSLSTDGSDTSDGGDRPHNVQRVRRPRMPLPAMCLTLFVALSVTILIFELDISMAGPTGAGGAGAASLQGHHAAAVVSAPVPRAPTSSDTGPLQKCAPATSAAVAQWLREGVKLSSPNMAATLASKLERNELYGYVLTTLTRDDLQNDVGVESDADVEALMTALGAMASLPGEQNIQPPTASSSVEEVWHWLCTRNYGWQLVPEKWQFVDGRAILSMGADSLSKLVAPLGGGSTHPADASSAAASASGGDIGLLKALLRDVNALSGRNVASLAAAGSLSDSGGSTHTEANSVVAIAELARTDDPHIQKKLYCEDGSGKGAPLSIECPDGLVLKFYEAEYGRRVGSGLCPHETADRANANCATKVMSFFALNCAGRSTCSFAVSAGGLNSHDPCVGVLKYLQLEYKCVKQEVNSRARAPPAPKCTPGAAISHKKILNLIFQMNYSNRDRGGAIFEYEWIRNVLLAGVDRPVRVWQDPNMYMDDALVVSFVDPEGQRRPPRGMLEAFKRFKNIGLMHMGDEKMEHDTSLYDEASYTFRFYYNQDYERKDKVMWLPLGSITGFTQPNTRTLVPASRRSTLCNFVGSLRSNREEMLKAVNENGIPCRIKADLGWAHPDNIDPPHYHNLVADSVFTLSPWGNNQESMRMWEALQAGSIPIFQRTEDRRSPLHALGPNPIPQIDAWADLPVFLDQYKDPQKRDDLQEQLMSWWIDYKRKVQQKVKRIIDDSFAAHYDSEC